MADKKLILGYWHSAGLASPLRYILSYAGADWRDELYAFGEDKWSKTDKAGLGIPLANLPYLIDGDFKISESSAIIRYLPKRLGKPELLGKNNEDEARVNQILGVIRDIQQSFVGILKDESWTEKKEEVYGQMKAKLSALEDFVKEKYALGYLTIADFQLADFVFVMTHLFPDQTKDLKKLQQISASVYELP